MLASNRFLIYGDTGHHEFDAAVLRLVNDVTNLQLGFSHIWYETWPDGERNFSLEDFERIAGRHVIIFSCPSTNELELDLKDIVTASKHQYGAKSVTVVMGFLRYRRQDHQTKHEEITRLRWFIKDLKGWGADRLIVCDPHSKENTRKYCQEFGIELYISDPTLLFADAIKGLVRTLGGERVVVYSPDFGSVGRALSLAKAIGVRVIATPKQRINRCIEIVKQEDFLDLVQSAYGPDASVSCDVQNLKGLHIFTREDEVSTGGTAAETAKMLRQAGAKSVRFIATHPVCARGWKTVFFPRSEPHPFDSIYLGNTRPRGEGETAYRGSTGGRVETVDLTPALAKTLAEALKNIKD